VRHQHQIARFVPAVVQRVVVDVTQDRSCPNTIRRVLCVDELAQMIHHRPRVLVARLQCRTTFTVKQKHKMHTACSLELKTIVVQILHHTRSSVARLGAAASVQQYQ